MHQHTKQSLNAYLLLYLQKRIDVVFEEAISVLGEVPHLVDFEQLVTLFQSLLKFQGDPRSMESSFGVVVTTGFLLQGISTDTTQWEHQLTLSAVWKHRMVQGARWKDGAFH